MSTTMRNVIHYIDQITDDDEVDQVLAALQACHDRLEDHRATSVRQGDEIVLRGAMPRYLDGMKGTLLLAEDGYGVVELTVEATGALRFMPENEDFAVGSTMRYVLPEVALSCCQSLTPHTAAA